MFQNIVNYFRKRRTYEKLLGYLPQSIEKGTQQWSKIDSSLKHLVKRLIEEEKKDQFIKILKLRGRRNGENETEENGGDCVIIKNPSSVDTLPDKGCTHVLSVRVFAPNLHLIRGDHQLKSSEKCSNGFQSIDREYCINPYHYEMKDYEGIGFVLERKHLEKTSDKLDEPISSNYELEESHAIVVPKEEEDLIDNGCRMIDPDGTMRPHAIDPDIVGKGLDVILKRGLGPSGRQLAEVTVRLETPNQPWMVVTYGEKAKAYPYLEPFYVRTREFVVESGSTKAVLENRLVVPTRKENGKKSSMDEFRQKISGGIKLYQSDGKVFMETRSDHPIYLKAYLANLMNEKNADTVMEINSKMTLKVWDDAEFVKLFSKSCGNYMHLERLTKWGKIQIGFGEKFGYWKEKEDDEDYSFKVGPDTGCWLYISLPHVHPVVEKTEHFLREAADI